MTSVSHLSLQQRAVVALGNAVVMDPQSRRCVKLSVEKYIKEIIGLEMENVSKEGVPFPFDTIECWLDWRLAT